MDARELNKKTEYIASHRIRYRAEIPEDRVAIARSDRDKKSRPANNIPFQTVYATRPVAVEQRQRDAIA